MSERSNCQRPSNPDQSEDFFRNINIQFLIHELKSPLDVIETNIRMLLELQKQYGRLNDTQQNILKRSMHSTEKLRNIIYSLLEVGSSQTGRIDLQRFNGVQCTIEVLMNAVETIIRNPLDAFEINTDVIDFLAANGIVLSVSPDIREICLHQDKTKFMYILGNLIRNGLHHKSSKVTVDLALKGNDLEISVCDDGPGIDLEHRKILFKCFASKHPHPKDKNKGHGLGLSSSRILARYLGGDITFNSQYRKGARFVLRLPLSIDVRSAREKGYEVHLLNAVPQK